MNNILITSAGRRVSLVKFFKIELSKFFPGAKVFSTDIDPEYSSACRISDGFFIFQTNFVSSQPFYRNVRGVVCLKVCVNRFLIQISALLIRLLRCFQNIYTVNFNQLINAKHNGKGDFRICEVAGKRRSR